MNVNMKSYKVRGYIKLLPNGRYVGMCLSPHIVAEATTQEGAYLKLRGLLHAYMIEALKDGELEQFMARKAPAKFWFEYAVLGFLVQAQLIRQSFMKFHEVTPTSVHA